MLTSTQVQPESAHLDALIKKLKGSGESELLVEHLQTAHAYLHGAMAMECAHNLELARHAANALSAKPLQDEAKEAIAGLLQALDSSSRPRYHGLHRPVWTQAPPVTAEGLGDFLHGDDVSFGIFYPKKHVVAVFPSFDLAQAAHQMLSGAGFRMWELIVVSGEEVERFLEEIRVHRPLWDDLVAEISRLLDTEANLVDRYAGWARHGYGFLVVRSPTGAAAERIAEFLEPLRPVAMHWFMSGYIRHLTEGN
jgi:hypothetical protein